MDIRAQRSGRPWHRTAVIAAWCVGSPIAPGFQRPTVASVAEPGRVSGVATLAPVLTVPHRRIRFYDEPGMSPPKRAPQNPMANVVIYLDGSPALRGVALTPSPGAGHPAAAMHQRDASFVPHVLPVVAGTTVEFPNDDPVFHDVFSLSSTHTFDLHRYPQGESRAQRFERVGVVEVYCHIHADMNAYILVLDNPHFVIPDSTGRFELDGIPPGDYRMVAWYERANPVVTSIHIAPGVTTRQDVRIPIPADP